MNSNQPARKDRAYRIATIPKLAQAWSVCGLILAWTIGAISTQAQDRFTQAQWWVTTRDQENLLSPQSPLVIGDADDITKLPGDSIRIHPDQTFQTMLGMGSSLEHATCFNLMRLSDRERSETIARLVASNAGIGMNLMRICIGTPDFTGDPWYTYNDLPAGETDPDLRQFSIDKDQDYVIPVLRSTLEQNPQLLFFASAWSPPGWMKSSGSVIGGQLLPKYYPVYAQYLVRFIQAYQAQGVPIYAITVQNEPGVDRQHDSPEWHYPSCRWTADQERVFIGQHLGPALAAAGLETKIWCYDHNYNVAPTADGDDPGIAYPSLILRDPVAAKFVSGVAFHGYAGKPEGMAVFGLDFPDIPTHFTEGSVFGISGAEKLIAILAHGASSYNAWVTMIDTDRRPNNGPFRASKTLIMLDNESETTQYRLDYWLYGQFMKFIRRGAVRLGTTADPNGLPHVAFRNPDDTIVTVIANNHREDRDIKLLYRQSGTIMKLPARSVVTARFSGAVQ